MGDGGIVGGSGPNAVRAEGEVSNGDPSPIDVPSGLAPQVVVAEEGRSNESGRLGLILGAIVWAFPTSGWTGPPTKAKEGAKPRETERLKEEYERLYGEGKYGEAAAVAERACAILGKEHGSESTEVLICLSDLAMCYSGQGVYEKAEPLLVRVLAIREKTLASGHSDVALSLNSLASLHYKRGAYEEAEPLFERALAIREATLGLDHADVAQSLNNLAMLYKERGEYRRAEPLYQRALAIYESALGENHADLAAALGNLGMLYWAQGAYGRAEPLLERALAVRERALGAGHPDVATSLNSLAFLHYERGAYEEAEPLFERALVILETALGPHHPLVALGLNNLAVLYQEQGAHGKAEPLLERALAIHEKVFGRDHPWTATGLNNLASLHVFRGAYTDAERLYERALAISERALGPDHLDVALSLYNLAFLHTTQGTYGKAATLEERALAIREKALGPHHPLVALSLINLADLYRNQEAFEKAEPLLERALAIHEKTLGPHHLDVAWSLSKLASLYHDQGNHEPALTLRRRALGIEEANFVRVLTVADEPRRMAFALKLSGSLDYALSLHLRAAPEHATIAQLALATLLRRKNRIQDLVTQSNAALRRSLPDDDRHLLDEISDVESQIGALSNRRPGPLGVEGHARRLGDLRQRRDLLWSEIAKHSALVKALDYSVTIEDVQRALLTGSVLVELIQYAPIYDDAGVRVRKHEPKPPPRYAAYLLFPDRFDWVDLGPAARIDDHIKSFRRALQTKQPIPPDLYAAVMRPIVDKLGSVRHLIIAPAGDLSLIPFGALHDGQQYLVEKYDIRYVTTGRDLLPPPATPPVATTPVTIVANPLGADLPDAELEADFLATLFPHARVLLDDQATETNVRTIERPLVLHMATHGFFGEARSDRDNPLLRSGLYLADIDQVKVDRERDDGQLTAYEVSGMDLRGTQLVVLSACETGLGTAVKAEGKELMSEGMTGLRRAFAMAGARTTVMSLWEVSGATTQNTMEAYYRKLAAGMGRGEAMQAVQLELLHTTEHAHPKDWAAFIVSGDDTPMVFPEGEEPRVVEEPQGPPPAQRPRGCAVAAPSPDNAPSVPALLLGLLGLGALRRRRA